MSDRDGRDLWRAAESDDDAGAFDDLSAVRADDELLDALGQRSVSHPDPVSDQPLDALLLQWRRDIDSEPIGQLVDTGTAVNAINDARVDRPRRRPMLVPVAAAAAVLALMLGSGLAARQAEPGDALWGLSRVLYAERAESVQAAASARDHLAVADQAISRGSFQEARRALAVAHEAMAKVDPVEERKELEAQYQEVSKRVPSPEPSTEPAAPVTTEPSRTPAPTTTPTSPPTDATDTTTTTTPSPPTTTSTTAPPETTASTVTGSSDRGDLPTSASESPLPSS